MPRTSLPRWSYPVLLAALAISQPAASATGVGQSAACTDAQSDKADTALDAVHDWSAFHRFYRQFAACDDGGPSEGMSEFVAHTLAHHWSWLPKLAVEIKSDPAFGGFVVRHIDATDDSADLEEVKRTATSLCPPRLGGLCKRIRTAAVIALRD